MNKKPVLLRIIIALIIILIFGFSIYPLTERDFYKTFESLVTYKGKDAADTEKRHQIIKELVELARKKQAADKNLFPSIALEQAADEKGVDLVDYIKAKGTVNNRDAISLVKKMAGASIRRGLDLNGGVEFFLELSPDESANTSKDGKAPEKLSESFDRYRDIAIEILRNRLESQNIFETEISPAGSKFISLKAPIVSKDEKLKLLNLIRMSAKLQFRLVHPENDRLVTEYKAAPDKFVAPVGYERMETVETRQGKRQEKHIYFVQVRPEMDGKDIVKAVPTLDQFGQRQIALQFNSPGGVRFGEVTRENVGRLLAIVLDGRLYSAPVIKSAIEGGQAVISGQFSREEAETIANALVSGSLPVKIDVEAVFDVDPTLGAESVKSSIYAAIVSFVAVSLFMLIYYLAGGLIADIALAVNVILLLGMMSAFECTLTLPGIAGIILTIGMAVDANVLIFERVREELHSKKALPNAIDLGYDRAFVTIFDSNVTTLLTSVILMWFGTGPIKGFAISLTIGIIISMFTAIFLTRIVFDLLLRWNFLKSFKMLQIFHNPNFNFMGIKNFTFALSISLTVLSIAAICYKGRDCLGIDFTGGTQIILDYKERVSPDDITKALARDKMDAKVSYKLATGAQDTKKIEIIIKDSKKSESNKSGSMKDKVTEILNKDFPSAGFGGGMETVIGGLVGWEFTKSAILSVFLSFLGIIIYVTFRFELAFGTSSVVALFHDVIISTGIFVILGGELSLTVVAAILTIIGYSINDTIVIFDRIRENLQLHPERKYTDLINLSVNQTLGRSILTAFTVFLVVLIIYIMGGVALNDFAFVMLVGIFWGAYSSIYVASSIVAVWHRKPHHVAAEAPSAKA